jgi:OHCU decarboxylase
MSDATTAASGTFGRSRRVKHPVDEVLPPQKLLVYGTQHVLAFYAGAIIVPILLAGAIGLSQEQLIHLINADLFTCGIASIIQSVGFWKVGVRLPLLQGVTFTAVSPMIAIGLGAGGGEAGLREIYGAVIVSGICTFFAAPYIGNLIRFFPPIVTGSVITIIGITLIPVAINDAVRDGFQTGPPSGKNLAYAMFTLAVIVVIQRVFKGFVATIAVLAGLVIGTTLALILGDANFDRVGEADVVGVTTPFHFGLPTFTVTAIISMLIVMLITAVETTGDVFATGEIVEKKVGNEDVSRALRADGLATTLGGVLNSFPYTCFAENVGLVRLTAVKSRWVVATAGAVMIVIGLIPKAGAIAASIPHSVLGGAALAMFATVAVVGIQVLGRVDFNDHRNVVIAATSIGLALLITMVNRPATETEPAEQIYQVVFGGGRWPEMFFNSGITLGSLTAIILNIVFFHVGKSFGPAVAGTPGGGVVRLDQVNKMSQDEFADTFKGLFQGARWASDGAYAQRPFADTTALRAALQDALFSGTSEQRQSLLTSFPDLGADQLELAESVRDQSALGLDRLNDDDFADFAALNAAYKEKYGFPLIVAVRSLKKRHDVLDVGWDRMEHAANQERATALIEIGKIVNYRFDDLVAEANPIHTARTQRFEQLGH